MTDSEAADLDAKKLEEEKSTSTGISAKKLKNLNMYRNHFYSLLYFSLIISK